MEVREGREQLCERPVGHGAPAALHPFWLVQASSNLLRA